MKISAQQGVYFNLTKKNVSAELSLLGADEHGSSLIIRMQSNFKSLFGVVFQLIAPLKLLQIPISFQNVRVTFNNCSEVFMTLILLNRSLEIRLTVPINMVTGSAMKSVREQNVDLTVVIARFVFIYSCFRWWYYQFLREQTIPLLGLMET